MSTAEAIEKFFEYYGPETKMADYIGMSVEELEKDILSLNPDEQDAHQMAEDVIGAANN